MNDKELTRFYKRQCVLSMLDVLRGKPPRIVGVRYQNDKTGEYLVSRRDGKGGMISEEEFKRLHSQGLIIFGHIVIPDENE